MSSQLVWLARKITSRRIGRPTSCRRTPQMRAALPRNQRGQGEGRRNSRHSPWAATQAMRARTRPASLRPIRSRSATSILAIERDAIKLHAVIDEAEAQPLGHLLLAMLKLRIDEFEHLAGPPLQHVHGGGSGD